MSKTQEEISKMIDTPEGRKQLGIAMADELMKHMGLTRVPEAKPKAKAKPVTLVDIQGKVLKVGQRVVFCDVGISADLDIGVIAKVSPKSVYIKRDMKDMRDSGSRQRGKTPKDQYYGEKAEYCTKRLVTSRSEDDNPDYNRIEVYVI